MAEKKRIEIYEHPIIEYYCINDSSLNFGHAKSLKVVIFSI